MCREYLALEPVALSSRLMLLSLRQIVEDDSPSKGGGREESIPCSASMTRDTRELMLETNAVDTTGHRREGVGVGSSVTEV